MDATTFEITNVNNSWCNLCDELNDSPKKKEILEGINFVDSFGPGINKTSNTDEHTISIGEILAIEYDKIKLSELELLKYQTYVASQVKKYVLTFIENPNLCIDMSLHLSKLEWLLKTSNYLSKKRNLKEIQSRKKGINGIQRNSYEFCEYNYKCTYNKTGKCTKKHFVHNYVNSEVFEMIKYLSNDKIKDKNPKEIYTSINTISYILNHMREELSNVYQTKCIIKT